MTDRISMPVRIQLSRRKGWRLPPNTVAVARPGKWGNPFKIGEPGIPDAAAAVAAFREFAGPRRDDIRRELRGKNLACWCRPGEPCHGDVLLEIANADDPASRRGP
jgi:hypothetical protein